MNVRKMMALAPAVGRNDVGRIEAICSEALGSNPGDEMALMILADTYWRNNQPEKALPHVLKALELEPDDFHALRIAAGIYAARGEHATAYQHAKRLATAISPIFPPARTASRVLAPFRWLAKARRLDERIQQDNKDARASYTEWVQWSREYVSWYESRSQSAP